MNTTTQFPSQVGVGAKKAIMLLATFAIVALIAIALFNVRQQYVHDQAVADKLKAGWTYPDPSIPKPPVPTASQIHYPTTAPAPPRTLRY